MAKTPRRSWLVLAPAAALVGLGVFVVGRFWLTDAPLPASFGPLPEPVFAPMPRRAERAPAGPQLDGSVSAPRGEPVEDVFVYASPGGVPTWDLTDADGRFQLDWPAAEDLPAPPSFVELSVAAWGYPPVSRTVDWGAASIEVRLPEPEPPTPQLPDVASSPLRVRAQPARARREGAPLELELVLEPVDPPEVFSAAVTRRLRCDASGAFELDTLAHGRYRASVLPAWAAGGSWPDLLGGAVVEFGHPRTSTDEVELRLADGALTGVLTDPEGAALEGALALLADAAHPERLWPPCFTDDAGRFRFDDLPAGTYRLVLSAGEGRLTEEPVVVVAGELLELALPPLVPRAER